MADLLTLDQQKQLAMDALAKYQGASVPAPAPVDPTVAAAAPPVALAQAPAPVPEVAPVAEPAPVVDNALPPAAAPTLAPNVHETADWSMTKLSPQEEAQFLVDMQTKPGYKDWYNEAKKSWGHAPNFNDPENDYDYRGAWKGGVVPSRYEGDGTYHWGSSLPDGRMLKAPDHPTAWMEHFMRGTGKDPVVDLGLRTEDQGLAYVKGKYGVGDEQAKAILHGKAELPSRSVQIDPKSPNVTNSRGALNEMGNATEQQIQATQAGADAKVAGNNEQADLMLQQQKIEAEHDAKLQTMQVEQDKLRNQFQTEARTANEQADKLQAALGDHRTRGQKILGILGTALAGVADSLSGFSGQKTNFMGSVSAGIDKAVETDLAKQREVIDSKRKEGARKMSELALYEDFFKDKKQAEQYFQARRKEAYALSLEAAAKRSSNAVVQADGAAGAAKIKAEAIKDQAQLLASKENAALNAAAQAQRQEAAIYRPGATALSVLEAKEKANQITGDEAAELDAHRARAKALADEKGKEGKLSEGQQKAAALYQSSTADANRIQTALAKKTLPNAAIVRAAESSFVPDSVIPAEAEIYRSARALVNDTLRDESGASIGAQEKEELLAPLKSTDPSIREQGYQRILAKRDAMGAKVPTQQIKIGGPVQNLQLPPESATVQMKLPDGRVVPIKADRVEEALKRGASRI